MLFILEPELFCSAVAYFYYTLQLTPHPVQNIGTQSLGCSAKMGKAKGSKKLTADLHRSGSSLASHQPPLESPSTQALMVSSLPRASVVALTRAVQYSQEGSNAFSWCSRVGGVGCYSRVGGVGWGHS